MELQGGNNLYRYTTNPVNDIDPLGLMGNYEKGICHLNHQMLLPQRHLSVSHLNNMQRRRVKDEIGEEFEVFAHGTTRSSAKEYVEMQGQNLSARAGNQDERFYTALDQGVAEEFAARSASKVGDEAALIGIALPKSVVKRLRDQKLIRTIKIDDRSGLQTVFEPGALKILQVEGFFFHID